ncbi:hypothetical protein DBP19_35745 [Streptomyces sp. CS090A]|nr:hypothetical protein DBP19_35745 [Streptomyces sp. CS090A]
MPPVQYRPQRAKDVGAVPRTGRLSEREVVLPWWYRGASQDGRRLLVYYVEGNGCSEKFLGFAVTESPTAVELTPVAREAEKSEATCPAVMLLARTGRIDLQEPLGERHLLHTAVTNS